MTEYQLLCELSFQTSHLLRNTTSFYSKSMQEKPQNKLSSEKTCSFMIDLKKTPKKPTFSLFSYHRLAEQVQTGWHDHSVCSRICLAVPDHWLHSIQEHASTYTQLSLASDTDRWASVLTPLRRSRSIAFLSHNSHQNTNFHNSLRQGPLWQEPRAVIEWQTKNGPFFLSVADVQKCPHMSLRHVNVNALPDFADSDAVLNPKFFCWSCNIIPV